ncbi:MAG: uracil-DNA glycosylase family protein [Terriglobales bacterium]
MEASRRVLSDLNGPWDAEIVVVAEAPGRLGAEVTGIPLYGDRTGDRFEAILTSMNWPRSEIFITNAILCNPRDDRGNNSTPSRREIRNCSSHLRRTIEQINPLLVVAMGRIALEALSLIENHGCDLRGHAGRIIPWFGRKLGILYHSGPRTVVHRSWSNQLSDAAALSNSARSFLDGKRYSCGRSANGPRVLEFSRRLSERAQNRFSVAESESSSLDQVR